MTVHYYRLRDYALQIRNAAPLCASLTERGPEQCKDFLSARRNDNQRAQPHSAGLKALDRHLHEPGVAFTSTHAHGNG